MPRGNGAYQGNHVHISNCVKLRDRKSSSCSAVMGVSTMYRCTVPLVCRALPRSMTQHVCHINPECYKMSIFIRSLGSCSLLYIEGVFKMKQESNRALCHVFSRLDIRLQQQQACLPQQRAKLLPTPRQKQYHLPPACRTCQRLSRGRLT